MQFLTVEHLDKPVSRIVYGTGRPDLARGDHHALLDDVLATGVTTFDTARVYRTEKTLGRWMTARGNRDDVVLVAKGAHPSMVRRQSRLTAREIREDVARSLEALGTDHLDLYLLHRDDPEVEVGSIVDALHDLRREGLVRAYGGSNWTHGRIQQANEHAAAHGRAPFVASSPQFSLATMSSTFMGALSISADEQARGWYERTGLPVLAWSALASGFLSGRVRSDEPRSVREIGFLARPFTHAANMNRLARVEELARRKDLAVPQVALAYALSQPMRLCAVVTAGTGRRLQQSVDALDVHLSEQERRFLEE